MGVRNTREASVRTSNVRAEIRTTPHSRVWVFVYRTRRRQKGKCTSYIALYRHKHKILTFLIYIIYIY
jgi:hypothetical protein